ncbi:efflux transporter outer membrane subunit [Prosthecochloris sp. HL-130-GSB]|jgi:outer membrane protein, multidrug efflux system|uniref:efflux transporter outer membrane subunit n=1 Tax=Prosthecochloris sp. HL-130-GSB TaxID=1974213 RepID=UPI000A1C126A|nr:efflux transporter outer membrane subunit [Prosthecochloris sp. HL-130-GSB]ARM31753.1 RND transporter [Prosthecochloris sp. HL-130-GSB]
MNDYRMKTKGLFLPLCIVALGGCASFDGSARPDVDLPGSYRGTQLPEDDAARTAEALVAARIPYREFFRDPQLVQLIGDALGHNHDLLVAIKSMESARLGLGQSKLAYLPAVQLGAEVSSARPSDNGSSPLPAGQESAEEYSASFGASWELDVWGKIRNSEKAALARYLSSVEAEKAVRTRLVADVAEGYYNLLALRHRQEVLTTSMELAERTLSMLQLQYEAGLVNSLGVERQQAVVAARRSSLFELQRLETVQENALSVLCGRLPEMVETPAALLSLDAGTGGMEEGVPALLLQNRPDVKRAEMELMRAHSEAGVAAARLYPSFTISAEWGVNALRESDWFSFPGSIFSFLQGAVLQPVFQRGELKTAAGQANIERDKEEIRFRQAVVESVREVSDALAGVKQLEDRERETSRQVRSLRSAADNALLLFQSGMADYLDVISAQEAVLDAELSLADLRRGRLAARTELYRALGGGWQ